MSEKADRFNEGKLDYTILPWEIVGEVVKVFEFGARKYSRDNYQKGDGLPLEIYHQSAMRHIVASMNGEELDPESGLDHMAHVATNALMYLWQKQHQGKEKKGVLEQLNLSATKEQPAQRLGEPTSKTLTLTPFGECLRILRDLTDLQNDAPLEQHRKEWEETMKEAYEFLEKWDDLPLNFASTKNN